MGIYFGLTKQEKNLDFYFFIHYCYRKRYSFLETGKKSKDILPFEFLKYSSENTRVVLRYPFGRSI